MKLYNKENKIFRINKIYYLNKNQKMMVNKNKKLNNCTISE